MINEQEEIDFIGVEEMKIKRAIWSPPFRGLLYGSSQVGKTEYFIGILRHIWILNNI